MDNIQEKIRAWVNYNSINKRVMAEKIGMNQSYFNKFCKGEDITLQDDVLKACIDYIICVTNSGNEVLSGVVFGWGSPDLNFTAD